MPQDALTLRFLAEELNLALAGAKVNKIAQPSADEIVMTLYVKGKTVRYVLSANGAACRVAPAYGERENPLVAPNFCMLLRKYLTGATLEKAERVGDDRILRLAFTNKNDFFEIERKELYAEIMGKYSNLILTGDGVILGSIKSYAFDETNKRPLLTGMRYDLPPAQDKLPPAQSELERCFAAFPGGSVGDYLFRCVRGLAKSTADEIAFRFFAGQPERMDGETARRFAAAVSAFPGEDYAPCVLRREEVPVDFFVSPYRSLSGEYRMFDSLLAAEGWFYEQRERAKLFAEKKRRVLQYVAQAEKKLVRRRAVIAEKELDCRDCEELRVKGELLTAYAYRIPKGAECAELENYYDPENRPIAIRLDGRMSAAENAQAYFKRYQKKKRTLAAIRPQKEEVAAELSYLASVRAEAELAEQAEDFSGLEAELAENGYLKRPKERGKPGKKAKEPDYYRYEIEGFTVKAGRNNLSNDYLTSSARGGDLWLHTKGYHSAHVIVEKSARPFPESVIREAARICAYYSEGRNSGKIEVDYTLRRFVKKPAGAKSGFVFYTDFKTIVVDPDRNESFLEPKRR